MSDSAAPTYERVADALAGLAARPLPDDVTHAARRTLFNVLTVALGAARTPQVSRLAATLAVPDGVPAAPGIDERASEANAALLTGFAAHLDDYDDTHLRTVIHPGAAGLGAAWAAGWTARRSGPDLLAAYAIGAELQLRLGNAVSPEHYDRGWHITGTCGVLGAAVTAGLLLGLPPDRMADALRLASVQILGHREAFGTEVKPFHAGKAAANGMVAAREAASTRYGTPVDLGPLLAAFAPDRSDPDELLDGLGRRWELLANTFKPYPCGIVAHPGIDAAIQAHRVGITPTRVVAVDYHCHPLVPELMGRTAPRTGLETRFSAVHGVAAGLATGAGGLAQFDDAAAVDPVLAAMRDRVTLRPSDTIARDAAVLRIETDDGRAVDVAVTHARGSRDRPLTDEELIDKAEALVPGRAHAIWTGVGRLAAPGSRGSLPDLLAGDRIEVGR
ncbi:MmgE/PrpD family protein [Plantactinospora sp. GCM10030261]|uniref:MmgE/PrpD family protein n=1 Tax=Plantactinospora sp. GCM10030261 TaxID=3273420 RepID=UPI0036217CE1